MPWRLLADGVLVLHGLYVAFVVFGFLLILIGIWQHWAWIRQPLFRYAHLAAIGIVVVQTWLGVECPLTTLESWLRTRAGEAAYTQSFIQDWLYALLFYQAPNWVFGLVYSVFGTLVALAWWLAPPRR